MTAIMMIARQLCIIYFLYMCILIITWAKGVRVSRRHLHIFSFDCLVLPKVVIQNAPSLIGHVVSVDVKHY